MCYNIPIIKNKFNYKQYNKGDNMLNKYSALSDNQLIELLQDEYEMHELLSQSDCIDILLERKCINLFTLFYYYTSEKYNSLTVLQHNTFMDLVYDNENEEIVKLDADARYAAICKFKEITNDLAAFRYF